jgi:hypothetical protein
MNEYDPSDKYNRFEIGLEILTNLENERRTQKIASLGGAVDSPPPVSELQVYYPRPTLEHLIQELAPLPTHSVVIGVCDDGLPILLDLTNPASGSILLAGEAGCGKTRLLASMVQSVLMVTPYRMLRIAGITNSLKEWRAAGSSPHSYRWASPGSLEATTLIHELARINGQRCDGREEGSILLLVIDELVELLEKLDSESIDLLAWLINNGPACRVWTFATLDTSRVMGQSKVVEAFGTWLFGNTHAKQTESDFLQIPQDIAASLIPGAQFCLKNEGEWLHFWIPHTG